MLGRLQQRLSRYRDWIESPEDSYKRKGQDVERDRQAVKKP